MGRENLHRFVQPLPLIEYVAGFITHDNHASVRMQINPEKLLHGWPHRLGAVNGNTRLDCNPSPPRQRGGEKADYYDYQDPHPRSRTRFEPAHPFVPSPFGYGTAAHRPALEQSARPGRAHLPRSQRLSVPVPWGLSPEGGVDDGATALQRAAALPNLSFCFESRGYPAPAPGTPRQGQADHWISNTVPPLLLVEPPNNVVPNRSPEASWIRLP